MKNKLKLNVDLSKMIGQHDFESLSAYESPWLPIDYEQADSGKGCFDGSMYLFKTPNGIITGKYDMYDPDTARFMDGTLQAPMYFKPVCEFWLNGRARITIKPTHYRPIPSGWLGGV